MRVFVTLATAFLLGLANEVHGSGGWSYEGETGPDYWAKLQVHGSNQCGLHRQSPIDIEPYITKYSPALQSFKMNSYEKPAGALKLINNGHTAQVGTTSDSGFEMTIQGGPLLNTYRLLQFHFHWGKDSFRGSEHTVNGKRYPIELHLVHYNTKYNLTNSHQSPLNFDDGLAVVGVFFEVTKGEGSEGLRPIINELAKVKEAGTDVSFLDQWIPQTVIPSSSKEFFTYLGSLTTPPCSQIVTWIVMKEPLKISEAQLAEFRSLLDGHQKPIVDNFRPTLSRSGRTVEVSFNVNVASSVSASLMMLFTSLVFLAVSKQ